MTTNDSIKEHRRQMRNLWHSKKWRNFRDDYLFRHPKCDWCGNDSKIVHHIDDTSYGREDYFNESGIMALCLRCHWGIHHNCEICPGCKKTLVTIGGVCDSCRGLDPDRHEIKKTKMKVLRRELTRKSYLRAKEWRVKNNGR